MTEMKPIDKAIRQAGGLTALARALNRKPSNLINWRSRGDTIPLDAAIKIEMLTGVKAEELRPDVKEEVRYLRVSSEQVW